MVRLEQIRLLEEKVQKAVELIGVLRKENGVLKQTLERTQDRVEELELLIVEFKDDQGQIEEGILTALRQLDQLEEAIARDGAPETGSEAAGKPATSAETGKKKSARTAKPVNTPEPSAAPLEEIPASEPEADGEIDGAVEVEDIAEDLPEDLIDEGSETDETGPELDIF